VEPIEKPKRRPRAKFKLPERARDYVLTSENLAQAVAYLVRIAVEKDLVRADDTDATARRTTWDLLDIEQDLADVVAVLLHHRDRRHEMVRQLRCLTAAKDAGDRVKRARAEWEERRREGGPTDRSYLDSREGQKDAQRVVEGCFRSWGAKLDEAVAETVTEAILRSRGPVTVAAMVGAGGERTLQGLASALEGKVQSQGLIRFPEEAGRVLIDSPPDTRQVLRWLLELPGPSPDDVPWCPEELAEELMTTCDEVIGRFFERFREAAESESKGAPDGTGQDPDARG
jgi:hypothetical protein